MLLDPPSKCVRGIEAPLLVPSKRTAGLGRKARSVGEKSNILLCLKKLSNEICKDSLLFCTIALICGESFDPFLRVAAEDV